MKLFTAAIALALIWHIDCITQKNIVLSANMDEMAMDDDDEDDDSVRFVVTPVQDSYPTEDEASITSTSILPVPDQDDEMGFGRKRIPDAPPSSVDNSSSEATAKSKAKNITVECLLRELPVGEVPIVVISNSSMLMKILTPNVTNATAGECNVVLFYSSQCIFSARMAPHFNALPRVFPGLRFYALDTMSYSNIHIRYGIVSVPNVLLFHHGKPVARCNDTQLHLENLVGFISKYTNLTFNGTLNVTSADMTGPVPATIVKRIDYVLIFAWIFTIFCLCLYFLKSSLCHRIVETVRNTWIEAEAQHEHVD